MTKIKLKLKGKIVQYSRHGSRAGRIIKVERLKRSGAIRFITVRKPSYNGSKNRMEWNGPKVRLRPAECEGIVYRRTKQTTIVPLEQVA